MHLPWPPATVRRLARPAALVAAAPGLVLALTLAPAMAAIPDYPPSRRVEQVDTYHGTAVRDPYRWLETDVRESAEVAEWVAAQNRVTFAHLESIPGRAAIERRLTALWDFAKYSAPFKAGGRYYHFRNDGLQNQSVLYVQETLLDPPRLLIDPNQWSADGTVALDGLAFSEDGIHVAYGVADGGSDWRTWRVMEIATGRLLDDELRWVKFSDPAWTLDGKGFFYGRYEEPRGDAAFQELNLNQKVYYHRAGTPQAEDVLVYHRPEQPQWGYDLTVTEEGRYLVLTVWKGTAEKYRVYWKDLAEPYALPVALIDEFENDYTFAGSDGPLFYFKTDLDAPRRRLIAIDIRHPGREQWREIIAQSDDTLESVSFVANLFVASYLHDAQTRVRLFARDGRHLRDIDLPGIGTAGGFGGRRADTETFYNFASFTAPPSNYRYDFLTGQSTLLQRAEVDFAPEQYEVSQVFYTSKDGTRVPMFLAHRKGLALDGTNPTILYGYGGFNASMTPWFSISRLAWMELGGLLAVANLRGGGEYGEAWHEAGMKLAKQNGFDDFIAAAEWLIAQRYTRPDKLVIHGGSNGGLLVGAVMTQRPELFGAALPEVGVMDMLRFHLFTAGRFWVDEYGSPENPQEFAALFAYSPYHNIREGARYPATLITTADTDDRVVPAHSFKFAAALQHAQAAGGPPVLIRIETRAGHGAGTPTAKLIAEVADKWAFLVQSLGVALPAGYGGDAPPAAAGME